MLTSHPIRPATPAGLDITPTEDMRPTVEGLVCILEMIVSCRSEQSVQGIWRSLGPVF